MILLSNPPTHPPLSFSFPILPLPHIEFTFSTPVRVATCVSSDSCSTSTRHRSSRKRRRPHTLISPDIPTLPSNKKRRLRLRLITSPLSRPFSNPASYIADHGTSRVAVWAKTKGLGGKGWLRKAAILNRARLGGLTSPTSPIVDEGGTTYKEEGLGIAVSAKRPPKAIDYTPETTSGDEKSKSVVDKPLKDASLPIPLGISNYEALDDWHGYPEEEDDDDDDDDDDIVMDDDAAQRSRLKHSQEHKDDDVYSDFNFFDSDSTAPNEDDYDEAFSVLPPEVLKGNRPPSPPDVSFAKMVQEKKSSGEFSFFTLV